jgi:hypothetical protein
LNIKEIKDIVINNWKYLETSAPISEIRRNWIQNPNLVIFVSYKEKDRKIIKISNNSSIEKNDPINNSDLNFNKSRDNIVFELDINPSPALYSTINKPIMIDNSSEEENLLRSRFLIIDSIGRRSGGKNG